MNRKAFLIPVAAALCLAAAPAHAAYDRPSMKVVTSDLDLSTAKDVRRLYERIYEAAMVVCGSGNLDYFVAGPPERYLACRNATLDAALSKFDAPRVVDLRARLQARPDKAAVMR